MEIIQLFSHERRVFTDTRTNRSAKIVICIMIDHRSIVPRVSTIIIYDVHWSGLDSHVPTYTCHIDCGNTFQLQLQLQPLLSTISHINIDVQWRRSLTGFNFNLSADYVTSWRLYVFDFHCPSLLRVVINFLVGCR
jgi:hypothetical protein